MDSITPMEPMASATSFTPRGMVRPTVLRSMARRTQISSSFRPASKTRRTTMWSHTRFGGSLRPHQFIVSTSVEDATNYNVVEVSRQNGYEARIYGAVWAAGDSLTIDGKEGNDTINASGVSSQLI